MFRRVLTTLVLVVMLSACDSGASVPTPVPASSQPSYVKDVVALKDGTQAFSVYFVLADKNSAEVAADGDAKIEVLEYVGEHNQTNDQLNKVAGPLYSSVLHIKKSEFTQTQVGVGALKHDALIYNVGRLPYSKFSRQPSQPVGTVWVTFSSSYVSDIVGKSDVIFEK